MARRPMRRGGVDEEASTRRRRLGGVGEGYEASARKRWRRHAEEALARRPMHQRGGIDKEASTRRRLLGGVGKGKEALAEARGGGVGKDQLVILQYWKTRRIRKREC